MIHLEKITNSNVWQVCRLTVREDQKHFVADNIESIAEAYATNNEGHYALPLAVYHDDLLVGFVLIGKGTAGYENECDTIKENYSIWRIMIDQKYQGMGYGKKTLDLAIDLIRTFPAGPSKKVWLSYEVDNDYAKRIYFKYGFVENGEMCGKEPIAIMDL